MELYVSDMEHLVTLSVKVFENFWAYKFSHPVFFYGVFTPESPHQGLNQSSCFDTFYTFREGGWGLLLGWLFFSMMEGICVRTVCARSGMWQVGEPSNFV